MRPVSVSIVVHNTDAGQLRRALECLSGSASVGRIMIVDNSSSPLLEPLAKEFNAEYRYVENRGFGAGHNIAIRESIRRGYPYHLVMNSDVWWSGDVISDLTAYLEANPEAGIVMPKVRYPDGVLQYSCRMLPTPFDSFARRFLPPSATAERMRRYLLKEADHDAVFNVPYLLGCFLLFRTSALEAEGLFDERFFLYPEDIDITRRLHRNWKTIFYGREEIVHVHAVASRRDWRLFLIHTVNMIRYFNKWGWFFDSERKRFNSRLLRTMPKVEGEIPEGCG